MFINRISSAADREKTISDIEKRGLRLRLNCTLMKDFVGSADSIKRYIEWAVRSGVKDIYFRNLSLTPTQRKYSLIKITDRCLTSTNETLI